MTEPLIREYSLTDIPALSRLWMKTFGDSEEFVNGFFRLLPDMGSCVVIECSGEIIAEASVITGLELADPSGISKVCGYIYALAVDKRFRSRGFGAMLCEAAADLAQKRGAQIVCTFPASKSLYKFYNKTLGFTCALYRSSVELAASDTETVMRLSATEYAMYRESMLRGKTYLRPSFFTMSFLEFLCSSSGGGLFASLSGICTATVENNVCVVHEIIAPDQCARHASVASVAGFLGCSKAQYYLPSSVGEPFISAVPGSVPSDAVWNLAFE